MENRKETTIEERKLGIKVSDEGKSQRNIAKVVGRSVNCIQNILQKLKKTGMLINSELRGRKKIMNSITERRVIHQVKIDPKISAPKIGASTSNTLGQCFSKSISFCRNGTKSPKKAGYSGRVTRKKPLIGKRNRVKRLKFTKEHILKPQQFWNKVIFSDESKFNIFGSDGRRMVWRKQNTSHHPKHTIPTVKHGGGSVMQDNDPKHTAFVVKEWLLYHCQNQLNTPPQSPDLNVIENLWSHLERAVQNQITNKEQLKSVLQEEWLNIAPETTRVVGNDGTCIISRIFSLCRLEASIEEQKIFYHYDSKS
ncbi:transposable element Tc1 transposase [Trichonephila clavipes]|nr:transposable element Tc1 transposase [Trichonephila clavipes]